jgi:nitrite reductase (NADH) large subunit
MKAKVQALLPDNNQHIVAVQFQDNTQLDCDLFVMAIGVQPNMALAKAADLVCERGIVVNDNLLTSDANVYAVGECIQHRGDTFGLVAPLFVQAKVCANQLSELNTASYVTPPTATKLKVTGIKLFSVGDFLGDAQTESIMFKDNQQGVYKKLVIKANQLVGAVLYGDTADGLWYQEMLEQQVNIADIRSQVIFGKACV